MSLQKRSADFYEDLKLSFVSSLPLGDIRPITEPFILVAFSPSIPKSGKRTSALNFGRGEW